jgi:hypothetical protein
LAPTENTGVAVLFSAQIALIWDKIAKVFLHIFAKIFYKSLNYTPKQPF